MHTKDPPSQTDNAGFLRGTPVEGYGAHEDESPISGGRHRDPQSHKRWRRSIFVLVVLSGVGASAIGAEVFLSGLTGSPQGTSSTTTNTSRVTAPTTPITFSEVFVITASEDVSVNADTPDDRAGHNSILRVDGAPQVVTFLKFLVSDLGDRVTRLVLMMYSTTGSQEGFSVYLVKNSDWEESTLTFAGAPPLDELVGVSGSFRAGTVVQVELDPFANEVGYYSLALVSNSRTRMGFASLDSDLAQPQLLVRRERTP